MKLLKYYKNINRFVHKSKTNFVCKNYYFIFPKGFAYLKSFFSFIITIALSPETASSFILFRQYCANISCFALNKCKPKQAVAIYQHSK